MHELFEEPDAVEVAALPEEVAVAVLEADDDALEATLPVAVAAAALAVEIPEFAAAAALEMTPEMLAPPACGTAPASCAAEARVRVKI